MNSKPDIDFGEILDASERWMQAWQDQDQDALEELMAPDFVLIVASAPHFAFERDSWIELAVGPYVCTRFDYEHVQFHQLSREIVAMSAIADSEARLGEEDRSGRFFVTDLWRNIGTGWLVCARYSSPPSDTERTITYMVGAGRE